MPPRRFPTALSHVRLVALRFVVEFLGWTTFSKYNYPIRRYLLRVLATPRTCQGCYGIAALEADNVSAMRAMYEVFMEHSSDQFFYEDYSGDDVVLRHVPWTTSWADFQSFLRDISP